jgi:hypothetical protein
MDSHRIKTAAICWFRFAKRWPYVCTEAGHYSADVLAANLETMVEVEVKISKADLRADFVKPKHDTYKNAAIAPRSLWIPNRFYYAVPEEMTEYTVDFLKDKNPTYGVITCGELGLISKAMYVVKKAGTMHTRPPKAATLEDMLLRMGSEIANFHIYDEAYRNIKRDFKDLFEGLSGAKDIELEEAPSEPTP